jgi:hypothetical protein
MTGVDYGAIEIVRIEKIEGITTDRRILFFLTESVWPPSAIPSYFRIWREEKWPFSTIQTTTTTSNSNPRLSSSSSSIELSEVLVCGVWRLNDDLSMPIVIDGFNSATGP